MAKKILDEEGLKILWQACKDRFSNSGSNGGIVPVDNLPTATEEEYQKHKLYLNNGNLYYMIDDSLGVVKAADTGTFTIDTLPEMSNKLTFTSYPLVTSIGNKCYFSTGFSVNVYDVSNNTYEQIPSSSSSSSWGPTTMYDKYIYYFGTGSQYTNTKIQRKNFIESPNNLEQVGTHTFYDWQPKSGIVVGNYIYIFGRCENTSSSSTNYKSVKKYNMTSKQTTDLTNFPVNCLEPYLVKIGTDIYIYPSKEGTSITENNKTNTWLYKWDTLTDTCELVGNSPVALSKTCMVAKDNSIYFFGGQIYSSGYKRVKTIYRFDTDTKQFTLLEQELPIETCSIAGMLNEDGNIYLFGGDDGVSSSRTGYQALKVNFAGATYSLEQIVKKTELDNYYNKTEVDGKLADKADTSALNNKQDTLVSGINIKTVNGQSLLGNGDLPISGGGSIEFATEEEIRGLFDATSTYNIINNASTYANVTVNGTGGKTSFKKGDVVVVNWNDSMGIHSPKINNTAYYDTTTISIVDTDITIDSMISARNSSIVITINTKEA